MGTQHPLPNKGAKPPIFGSCLLCSSGCMIKMPLGTIVGLGPGRVVLHGDPAPPPKRGTAPQFSAYVCCGQTAAHLSYCWSSTCFNLPHLHLVPPLAVTPFDLRQDIWRQKTRVPGVSCDAVCVILYSAVLVGHWLLLDSRTDKHTQYDSIYCGSIVSCGRNQWNKTSKHTNILEMWANAERDGRPVEYTQWTRKNVAVYFWL